MSSLLKEAIVDATALRDAALKNAETAILDKYSEEVKTTLNQLLEQEEEPLLGGPPADDAGLPADLGAEMAADTDMGLDGEMTPEDTEVVEDVPLAATNGLSNDDGTGLTGLPEAGEDVSVTVDLDALQEAVRQLSEEQEILINEEDLSAILGEEETVEEGSDPGSFAGETAVDADEDEDDSAAALAGSAAAEEADSDAMKNAGLEEEIEITEDMIEDIVERLVVDMGATLSGWAGRSSESVKYELERALAHRRSTDVQDELEIMKKAQEELVFENKQLDEQLNKHKHALGQIKETLQEVNLSNARLLYTNRVLRNTSLNERQKNKIAEAISQAGSVMEAKTIYETLERAAPTAAKQSPRSLSEAISRGSTSVIRASRQESTPSDPFQERMKRLAGIK